MNLMETNNTLSLSKKLAFLLRHCNEPRFICLDGGWADIEDVIKQLHINKDILEQIVINDEKGRFSFDETGSKIRANQGHSIKGVKIEPIVAEPPEILYHGTATRFLDSIISEGLKPMGRNLIHLSADVETAQKVGGRHGTPIVLKIDVKSFISDGNKLFLSPNGIWQAEYIPNEYISVI